MKFTRACVFLIMLFVFAHLSGCAETPGGDNPGEIDPEISPEIGVALAQEAESEPAPSPAPSADSGKVELTEGFCYIKLTDELKKRVTGKSYPEDDEDIKISYDDLRYIRLLHYDFNGNVQEGELIVNKKLADEVMEIFYELYKAKYPLTSVRLVDDYEGDDTLSTQANNTSAFNYRLVAGSKARSLHSYGTAIDINPKLNPYIKDGRVSPKGGEEYADRSRDFPGKIDHDDLVYKLFTGHGWEWGGDWKSVKDYQHFSKDLGY